MTLEFGVLGPIEVRCDGQPVALGGPQQRRIVATLLAERGQVVSIERLVDAVWPDAPPDGARRTVMTYVSRLRLALGDGHVLTKDPGYRLDAADDAIDAVRFERLVERARTVSPTQAITLGDTALALWRGRAYGEFADEWWALPHATRLEELRIVAAEQRAEALVAVGACGRAVADLEGLLVTYPLRERSVAQLMRAYEASGRQADALRVYARYRDHLAEETGLDPSEALRDLESSIVVGTGAGAGAGPVQSRRGYMLGDDIGQGAFATVYRATQPGVGREVAIKVIRAELADDPAFVRRFEAEAQLVAHLEHPHIVPLYDFWREPGGAYLVFRLLRGGSAQDAVRRDGPWSLDRVDRLVTEIGGALVAAHTAGVVHRDVKPANVLFDDAGNAYLADFGIATSDGERAPDAGPFALPSAGSPLYAPPEQFQRTAPSAQGDQYSFATMIWELLTGTPPFDGATASTVLRSKLERPLAPLRDRRPDLPGELDAVLQRATASRAEERYDDMRGLLDAWHRAVQAGIVTTDDLDAVPRSPDATRHLTSTAAQLSEEVANPYKGLRAFAESDARRFHGRDALVASLLEDVRSHAFVTVVGASGSGKSSLVSAGIVPRLRAGGMRVASMVPGEDPADQLRLALLATATEEPRPGGVAAMVRSVAEQAGGPLVIVIDQFEELWTLAPDDDRERFAHGLASAVDRDEGTVEVHVVATIRADFFDRPLGQARLGPLVAAHTFAVTPMSAAELHDAVVAPAAALGVVFEPGLDSGIVSEVANQPAGLPLLQFTLAELFDRRQGRVITRAAYESMGGIAGAIGSRAENLYAALDAAGQAAARQLLLRLVVPGDGTEDTRRRVRSGDLPSGAATVVELFETHRLLVADHDPSTREPTVEIAHEALLRSWPRLRAWLAEDRDFLRRLQHVGASAQAWADAGRPDSELYRGARLDAASDALQTRPDQFTELERDFVDASRAASQAVAERDRRARRRLGRALVATSVALVVALVAGSVALVQRREATRQAGAADVSRLVALSQSLTGTKRDVALLLALEAARRDAGVVTTGALQGALSSDLSFLRFLRTGNDSAGQIAFSADGHILYANPQDYGKHPVRVDLDTGRAVPIPVRDLDSQTWVASFIPVDSTSALLTRSSKSDQVLPIERVDLIDGHVLDAASIHAEAGHVTLSPDGTRAAVTTVGRTGVKSRVVILEVATMDVIASVDQPGPAYADQGPWFSQSAWIDDDRLVVGSPSGRLLVWAPGTRQPVRLLNDPPAPGTEFAYAVLAAPDGSQVVAGGSAMMAYDVSTGAPSWPSTRTFGGAIAIDPLAHVVWAQEAGSGSSRMFAYDLATGERRQAELDGQHGTVCDARVSPDATTIAVSSCNEGTVALWALDGATATGAPLEGAGWASSEDLWSPDGAHVAMFRLEPPDAVEVMDVRDGTRGRAAGVVASVSNSPIFRPEGVLQTVNDSNHVVEYDPETGRTHDTGIVLPGGHVSANVALRELDLAVYGLDDGTVVVIDTSQPRIVRTIKTGQSGIYGVGWSPDGRRLFAAGQSEQAQVFDVATGKKIATLPTPAANLIVSPDGSLMATAAFDGTVRFVDTTTLRPVGDPLSGGTSFAAQIQFTPDGRTFITSGLDNTLRIFDVASRRQVGVPIAITSWGAAISPDSKSIAITTDRGVSRLAIDAAALSRAACRAAGRNLTAAEWAQYVGDEPHRLCPY